MRTLIIPDDKKVFFTADTHYGHEGIIRYCLRPVLTAEERHRVEVKHEKFTISRSTFNAHNDMLVTNINRRVNAEDVLIIAGDVAHDKESLHEFVDSLVCESLHVIVGNHDNYEDLITAIGERRVHDRLLVQTRGENIVVDHYPGDSWHGSHRGYWHLFGHVHGLHNKKRDDADAYALSRDIGVDTNDYKPLSFDELETYFRSRKHRWYRWMSTLTPKENGGMCARVK